MSRFWSSTPLLIVMLGCASVSSTDAPLSADDFVLIDRTEAAYTVYAGIPKGQVEAIKGKIANTPKVVLVPWDSFIQDESTHVKARIAKDEYPGSRAAEGVVELIRKYPGNPIGLTWNGGMAITYNDYQYAKQTYRQYQTNPAEYNRGRHRYPHADPVNPRGHLGPLLGW